MFATKRTRPKRTADGAFLRPPNVTPPHLMGRTKGSGATGGSAAPAASTPTASAWPSDVRYVNALVWGDDVKRAKDVYAKYKKSKEGQHVVASPASVRMNVGWFPPPAFLKRDWKTGVWARTKLLEDTGTLAKNTANRNGRDGKAKGDTDDGALEARVCDGIELRGTASPAQVLNAGKIGGVWEPRSWGRAVGGAKPSSRNSIRMPSPWLASSLRHSILVPWDAPLHGSARSNFRDKKSVPLLSISDTGVSAGPCSR